MFDLVESFTERFFKELNIKLSPQEMEEVTENVNNHFGELLISVMFSHMTPQQQARFEVVMEDPGANQEEIVKITSEIPGLYQKLQSALENDFQELKAGWIKSNEPASPPPPSPPPPPSITKTLIKEEVKSPIPKQEKKTASKPAVYIVEPQFILYESMTCRWSDCNKPIPRSAEHCSYCGKKVQVETIFCSFSFLPKDVLENLCKEIVDYDSELLEMDLTEDEHLFQVSDQIKSLTYFINKSILGVLGGSKKYEFKRLLATGTEEQIREFLANAIPRLSDVFINGILAIKKEHNYPDYLLNISIKQEQSVFSPPSVSAQSTLQNNDIKAQLQLLKELYNDDLITEEEYQAKKKELLARM